MSAADPRVRLVAELPPDGCREVLARITDARCRGEAARVAMIDVDEHGSIEVVVLVRYAQREVSG